MLALTKVELIVVGRHAVAEQPIPHPSLCMLAEPVLLFWLLKCQVNLMFVDIHLAPTKVLIVFTWCRRWQRTQEGEIGFATGRSLGRLGSFHLAGNIVGIKLDRQKYQETKIWPTCIVTIRLSAVGRSNVSSSSKNIFNAISTRSIFPSDHNF